MQLENIFSRKNTDGYASINRLNDAIIKAPKLSSIPTQTAPATTILTLGSDGCLCQSSSIRLNEIEISNTDIYMNDAAVNLSSPGETRTNQLYFMEDGTAMLYLESNFGREHLCFGSNGVSTSNLIADDSLTVYCTKLAYNCLCSPDLRFNITANCSLSCCYSVRTCVCSTSTICNFSSCFFYHVRSTCKNTNEVRCDNLLNLLTCTSLQSNGEIVKTWHKPYYTCHGYDEIGQFNLFEISDMGIYTDYSSPSLGCFKDTSYNIYSCFCICRYGGTGDAFCNGLNEDLLRSCYVMYERCNEVGITPNGLKLGPNIRLINIPYGRCAKSISNIFYELSLAGVLNNSQMDLNCNFYFPALAIATYGGSFQGPPSTTQAITGIRFCHSSTDLIPDLELYTDFDTNYFNGNPGGRCINFHFNDTDTRDVWLGICGLVFIYDPGNEYIP